MPMQDPREGVMYEIVRNGKKNTHVGVLVSKRPSIPATEFLYEEIQIPGRDGSIYQETGSVKDITISVQFVFIHDKWHEQFREAKRWLLAKEDDRLILGDDPEYFYKVKHTSIGESERKVIESGEFTVDFICDGYQYLIEGENEYEIEDVLYNPYAICHPTYKIVGTGACQLTVNGKNLKAEVSQNLLINTDLMMAYKEDATLTNAAITGNYEELYLQEGDNTITLSNGFKIKVIPNWRCL